MVRPNNPVVRYNLACAFALNGDASRSLELLQDLAEKGLDYGIATDPDLAPIRALDAYSALGERLEAIKRPVNRSSVAFTIADKTLIPEGIAFDPVDSAFYLGSLFRRQIIRFERKSGESAFTAEGQDSLWSVLGMKVDAARRRLWVCSAAEEEMRGYTEGQIGRLTAVFCYDLTSRSLIRKYEIHDSLNDHLFNDLALTRSGDVYITDTFGGAIFRISNGNDMLELFVKPDNLSGANGIDLDSAGKYLFVAYFSGVKRIDLHTRESVDLIVPQHTTPAYSDGLYYYHRTLVAVQTDQHRINQYFLSNDLSRADSMRVLEANSPYFDYPTTGVIVGRYLYYIANSQYMSYDNGILWPVEKLNDVIILRVSLE